MSPRSRVMRGGMVTYVSMAVPWLRVGAVTECLRYAKPLRSVGIVSLSSTCQRPRRWRYCTRPVDNGIAHLTQRRPRKAGVLHVWGQQCVTCPHGSHHVGRSNLLIPECVEGHLEGL